MGQGDNGGGMEGAPVDEATVVSMDGKGEALRALGTLHSHDIKAVACLTDGELVLSGG